MTKANTRLLKNGRYVNRPLCEPWRTVHIQTKTKKYDFPWLLLHFLEAAGRLLCTGKDYIKLSMLKIQNKPKMSHEMSIMSNNPNFKNPSRYLGWSMKSLLKHLSWCDVQPNFAGQLQHLSALKECCGQVLQERHSLEPKHSQITPVFSKDQGIKEAPSAQTTDSVPAFFVGENRWRVDVVIRALRFRSQVYAETKNLPVKANLFREWRDTQRHKAHRTLASVLRATTESETHEERYEETQRDVNPPKPGRRLLSFL